MTTKGKVMQFYRKEPLGLGGDHFFFEVDLTQSMVDSGLNAQDISGKIESCARIHESSTIHLNIKTNLIPVEVVEAIKKLNGFGAGIVVTHGGQSTADESSSIDPVLLDAVERAARHGQVWHPQKGAFVHTRPKLF